ncbi:MAG: histidine kinase [Ferruginibacter sp.]
MNKKQLWISYGILCFLLIWGWDIIDELKFRGTVRWSNIFSLFHVTQFIYTLSTLLATRYVFKKYYTAKKYGKLALSLFAVVIGFIAFRYFLEQVILLHFFEMANYPANVHIGYYALDNLYYAIVFIVLGSLVFLLDHQLSSQKNEAALQQERTNAELAFLRSQVSPHFLFNSLNNIYALSCYQPERAPDAILTLSDLTRYMLYEKQEKVSIEKEWQYIESLVSLQQLRYEKPLQLQMVAEGSLGQMVEPYLLIPFVENAFKHGVVDNAERPVIIYLKSTAQYLQFEVENNIAIQQKDKDGGIGLENTRRRLELLYPGRHEFRAERVGDRFTAYLKINYQ